MQNNDNQKTYFIYVRSTAEKVPVTRRSTTLSIRKPTVSATKSRITAGVCALTALYGSATATASDVNTTLLVTLHLWINRSRTATAPSAIIFLTAASQWTRSSLTVCCWSSFLHDCVSSTRRLIQSFSFGRIIRRASPTVLSPESSVAPQKTFADQMKKYRTDLRRIAGDK